MFKNQKRNLVLLVVSIAAFVLSSTFVPVIVFMTHQEVVRHDNLVRAKHVTAYKIRGCEFVKRSKFGQAKVDGVWEEVPFKFLNDSSPDSTKPRSWERQSFGDWRWDLSSALKAEVVRLVAFHDCGGGIVTTVLGDFKVPKNISER